MTWNSSKLIDILLSLDFNQHFQCHLWTLDTNRWHRIKRIEWGQPVDHNITWFATNVSWIWGVFATVETIRSQCLGFVCSIQINICFSDSCRVYISQMRHLIASYLKPFHFDYTQSIRKYRKYLIITLFKFTLYTLSRYQYMFI